MSAAASAQWKIPFSIFGRSLAFHARLSAPLFSYVGRSPEYALHGLASYWLPPWSFMRVSVETGFTWRLRWSEENTARLLYTWDFYGMNELDGLHVLRIGTHTLGLGFGLKRM